jgi:hypothetical protein
MVQALIPIGVVKTLLMVPISHLKAKDPLKMIDVVIWVLIHGPQGQKDLFWT